MATRIIANGTAKAPAAPRELLFSEPVAVRNLSGHPALAFNQTSEGKATSFTISGCAVEIHMKPEAPGSLERSMVLEIDEGQIAGLHRFHAETFAKDILNNGGLASEAQAFASAMWALDAALGLPKVAAFLHEPEQNVAWADAFKHLDRITNGMGMGKRFKSLTHEVDGVEVGVKIRGGNVRIELPKSHHVLGLGRKAIFRHRAGAVGPCTMFTATSEAGVLPEATDLLALFQEDQLLAQKMRDELPDILARPDVKEFLKGLAISRDSSAEPSG